MLVDGLFIQLLKYAQNTPETSDRNNQESHDLNEIVHHYLWVVNYFASIPITKLAYTLIIIVAILFVSLYTFQTHLIVSAKVWYAAIRPILVAVSVHCARLIAKQKFGALLVDQLFGIPHDATTGRAFKSIVARIVYSFEAVKAKETSLALAERTAEGLAIIVYHTIVF